MMYMPLMQLARFLLVLGCLAFVACRDGSAVRTADPPSADIAPEIAATHLVGDGPRSLAEARGRPVVLLFWASYDVNAVQAFRWLKGAVARWGESVAVIGINVQDADYVTQAELIEFAREHGASSFPVVWDRTPVTVERFKPISDGAIYVIDGKGVIRATFRGFGVTDSGRAIEARVSPLAAQ